MLNQAILVGRVGRKETKQLKNGSDYTNFSIATNKKYKDYKGELVDQVTWHQVFCFNKLSEIAEKYVHKGDIVVVVGEIQHKKRESGEKAGQYYYSITANEIKFLPTNKKSEDSESKEDSDEDYNDIPF